MRRRVVTLAVLPAVLLLVVLVAHVQPATEPAEAQPETKPTKKLGSGSLVSTILIAPALEACDTLCSTIGCPGSNHENEEGAAHEGEIHECEPTFSCNHHQCGLAGPNPIVHASLRSPEFWLQLQSADGDALRSFLRNNYEVAGFNEERQALQIVGSGGRVIANLPLSWEQVEAITEDR